MMRPAKIALAFLMLVSLSLPANVIGQQKKNERPTRPERDTPATNTPTSSDEPIDGQQNAAPPDPDEVLKVETNLVSLPVVVNARDGVYVADLRKEEVFVLEDGVPQELTFFATVTQPFHVVLMIDTSGSTEDKLAFIQQSAGLFVEQLQPEDRVKVISFDDEIHDQNAFTNDRAQLKLAIRATRPGKGTKLYDAMQLAFDQLKPVRGRKAIVIFTDGVDYRSDNFRYYHNIRTLEESGVIVYPIRYDTRAETEQLARRQAGGGGGIDLGTIISGGGVGRDDNAGGSGGNGSPPRGTTGTTFPGGSLPLPGGQGGIGGIGGIPFPGPVGMPRTRRDEPNDPRRRDPNRRDAPARDDEQLPRQSSRGDDSIGRLLDTLYKTADGYLNDLAFKSGGKLTRAASLKSLPTAFQEIAAELRTQYSVGYYPINPITNGGYRKIKVKTTRKNATVRTRPGYIAKLNQGPRR